MNALVKPAPAGRPADWVGRGLAQRRAQSFLLWQLETLAARRCERMQRVAGGGPAWGGKRGTTI